MFYREFRGPKTLMEAAALIAVGLGTPALAQDQLSIATDGTGGVDYPMGGGLAEVINTQIEDYSATAEVTGASVKNMGLIARRATRTLPSGSRRLWLRLMAARAASRGSNSPWCGASRLFVPICSISSRWRAAGSPRSKTCAASVSRSVRRAPAPR